MIATYLISFYYCLLNGYSSHSNYRELEKFVKAVCPRKLIFNVDDRGDDCKSRAEFQQYLVKEYVSSMRTHVQPLNNSSFPSSVQPAEPLKALGRPQQHGYQRAIAEMTQRFDVNNKEMNKRKF